MANKYTTKKKYENRNLTTKYEYEQQRMADKVKDMPNLAEMYQATQDEYDAQKRRTAATLQAGNQIMTNLAKPKAKPAMQMELGKQLAQMDQNKGTQTKARKLQLTKAYMDAEKGTEQKKPVESKAILPDAQVRQNYTDRLNSYLSSISKKSPSEQYAALGKDKKSSWLNPSQSKELMDIVGVDAAKKYINDNSYDLAGKQKELETWKDKKAAAEDRANKAKADLDAQRAQMTPEEMQAAREEAVNLKGQQGVYTQLDTDGLKVSWRDSSGGWHNDDTFTKRPDDYYEGTMREEYDALLYDKIHGDGAYIQRVDSLQNDTEVIRLENEMDDLWNRLENHTLHAIPEADQYGIKQLDQLEGLTMGYSTEQRAAESEARYAQDQIKNLENEIRFLQEYEDLMGKHATPDQVGYIPENDRGQDDVWGMEDNPNNGIRTNDVHRIYSFANKGKEFIAWAPANKTPRITDEYSGSLLMNDKELSTFNGYYNNQQYKEASAFLQALQPYLRQRYSEFSSIYTQENAKVMPVTASGAAQAFMAADTVIAPIRTVASIFDPTAREADSAWYQTAKQADIIQQTIANELGGTAGKTYLSFMNSLRNVINATMTKGLGATKAVQKAFGLTTFASQIFQESTYKYLKETHNNYTESIGLAALDAVMETLEEMLPYEAMLNTSDRPAIRLLKNMLSEAGEEFTGATVGEKIRGLVTGRDNVQKRADEIFNQGGYYDANGRWIALDKRDQQKALNTADMQAIKEWHQEIVENTIGGAAGGGFGSVYGSIANRIDTAYKGREIKGPTNTVEGKTGAQRLYEIALTMDEGTKSQKLASKIKTTEGQVQKVGDYQLGRLAKAIAEDTENKYNETIKATIERDAKQKLTAAGVPEGQAQIYAEIMARDMISDKPMNNQDLQTLARDKRAVDVYRGYTVLDAMKELKQEIKTETKPQVSIMDTISEMLTPRTDSNSAAAADVEEAIKATKSPAEAMDYLMTKKAYLVSEKFAETAKRILDKNETAKNSKNFVDDAMKIMLAAQSLEENMPKVQMDEAAAKELWDQAKSEFDEKEAQRIQAQQPAVPGKGTAEFDGAEYGTEEWKEKVRDLSKTVRNQLGVVGEVATRMGLKVKIINDEDRTNVYGYELKDGTIYLNAAGLNRNGMNHHMLVTMAHEMTHWLEQNSLEGYKDLRTFALDSLRKEGKNIAQLMIRTINNHNAQLAETGETLDMNGAMAEIVAKSCENILSSQEMANALKDVNPSLYNKVKSFVRNFVARVNAAIQGMDPSLSEEAMTLKKYTDDIAKLWMKARNEAWNRTAPAEGQQPEEGVRFSLEEVEPVQPKGETWERGATYDEVKAKHPTLYELTAEENEKRNPTQVKVTTISYRKIYDMLKKEGFSGTILDASSGLGMGTEVGRNEYGYNVEDIEPYPDKNYKPMYTDYSKLNKKYDVIISNAVLNVIPQDLRDALTVKMGKMLNPGGRIFVNVRGKDVANAKSKIAINEGQMEYFIEDGASYQKGFRPAELKAYLEDALGDGYTVKTSRDFGQVSAIVTKDGKAQYSIVEDSEGKQLTKEQQEFFKDSKAVNSKGQLVKLYHGTTKAGFTEFIDTDDIGYFFTDDVGVASSYSDVFGEYAPKKAKNWDDVNKLAEELGYNIKQTEDGNYRWFENGEQLDWGFYKPDQYQQAMNDLNDEFIDQDGKKQNYAVYLNLKDPLIIDGNYSTWDSVVDTNGGNMHTWEEIPDDVRQEIADNMGYTIDELDSWSRDDYGNYLPVFDLDTMEMRTAQKTRDWVREAQEMGCDGVIFRNIMDEGQYGVGMRTSDVYVALNPNQIKSVNNTEPTEASNDIRFSVNEDGNEELKDGNGDTTAVILPGDTVAATEYSLASFIDDNERGKMIKALKKKGYSKDQIEKWMEDLDNVAYKIASNRTLYDYVADRSKRFMKDNGDVYKKTLDASTMCKKTRLFNGTFNLIQHKMPHTIFMPEDLIDLYNLMKEMDLETPCGMCYVQSRRRLLGQYTEEWLNEYDGEYKPNVDELTTSDGLEKTKIDHPEVYKAFVEAMNSKGVNNPKLVQQRTDYRGDIRTLRKSTIEYLKKIGGLRIQSFSDFETVHLLDMMQAVMDMKAVGLTAQAYTKVPDFAWAFRLNLSDLAR